MCSNSTTHLRTSLLLSLIIIWLIHTLWKVNQKVRQRGHRLEKLEIENNVLISKIKKLQSTTVSPTTSTTIKSTTKMITSSATVKHLTTSSNIAKRTDSNKPATNITETHDCEDILHNGHWEDFKLHGNWARYEVDRNGSYKLGVKPGLGAVFYNGKFTKEETADNSTCVYPYKLRLK